MPAYEPAHPLDNPIWNSLTSELARFAQGTALAKRWGDLAVALADHSDAAFADLYNLVLPGTMPVLFEADPPDALPGLTIIHRQTLIQMIATMPPTEPDIDAEVIPLTMADAPEILRLVEVTQPGPFSPEAMAFGPFIGIRVEGRLAAASGQRMDMPGYREICTVCTHPEFQGRGYAAALVSHAANQIFAQGRTPFLHHSPGNDRAHRLYERLGFRTRREVTISILGR